MRLFLFQRFRGFAPGRRGTFVSAKVTKTIDAPSGFIRGEGRELFEERPNSLRSNTGPQLRRASLPGGQPAGVGRQNMKTSGTSSERAGAGVMTGERRLEPVARLGHATRFGEFREKG